MAPRRVLPLAILSGALALAACADLSRHETSDPALQRRVAELAAQVRQKPDDVNLLVQLGELQDEANHTFEAADSLLLATQKDPKNVRARAALANVYLSMGYVQSAVVHLRECMSLDRTNPDCLFGVGTLFEGDQSKQGLIEARRAYRQILAIAPTYPKANLVKSRLDQLESRLGPDTGNDAPPHGAEGAEQGEQGDDEHDHGAEGAAGSGELPPGHPATGTPSPELPAGHPSTAEGNGPNPAIPGHQGGTGSNENVGQLNEFGVALKKAFDAVKRNDPPGAAAAFEEALKIRPNDATALAGFAQSLIAQGKFGEALPAAEKALAADPADVQARFTTGLALVRSGKDVARGIGLWEGIVKDAPDFAKQLHLEEQIAEAKQGGKPEGGAKPSEPAKPAPKKK